jgi:hypothetical protein
MSATFSAVHAARWFSRRLPLMLNLKDDPSNIADYLIQENGIDGVIQEASDGVIKSKQDGENYALSVWREVKTILRKKITGSE